MSDLFWPEIWGDLVKISRGEQRTEREQIILFFLNFEQCIMMINCGIFRARVKGIRVNRIREKGGPHVFQFHF